MTGDASRIKKDVPDQDLNFYDLWRWMIAKYPAYTDFRATGDPEYVAEIWFDN